MNYEKSQNNINKRINKRFDNSQKSNGMSTFFDHHLLPDINFNGNCLIKYNISIPKKVINLYISYKYIHNSKI